MNNTEEIAHPQLVAQIKITILDNGKINVTGFPLDANLAMGWMQQAQQALVAFFIAKAKAGELDENNKVIEKKILTRNSKLVDGSGDLLQ